MKTDIVYIIKQLQEHNIPFNINLHNKNGGIIYFSKQFKELFDGISLDNNVSINVDKEFINIFVDGDLDMSHFDLQISDIIRSNYLIEYGSVNPTGFMHVGNYRNIILGDFFYHLIKLVGNSTIHNQFYVNDGGSQINKLENNQYGNQDFFIHQHEISGIELFHKINQIILANKNIIFDEYIHQSDVMSKITDKETIEYFIENIHLDEKNRYYLQHTNNTRRVYLSNSLGGDSYFMADLKLFLFKKRTHPQSKQIIFLGEDQTEAINNMNLFMPEIQIVKYGMVLYADQKLSKRNNNSFNYEDIKLSFSGMKCMFLHHRLLAKISINEKNIEHFNKMSYVIRRFLNNPTICGDENTYCLNVMQIMLSIQKILHTFNNTSLLLNSVINICNDGLSRYHLETNLWILKIISLFA